MQEHFEEVANVVILVIHDRKSFMRILSAFIPNFLTWTLPPLNLASTIVPNKGLSQTLKQNDKQCRS